MSIAGLRIRLESDDFDADNCQVFRVSGREAIGRLFSFDVDFIHPDMDGFDLDALLGATTTLVYEIISKNTEVEPEAQRVYGIIAEIEDMLDPAGDHRTYRLRLMPRAHRLSLVQTQEIFLRQSVPDILRQKLQRVGLEGDAVALRLSGSYPQREFVVQFKETDLAFVSRLAEHAGISIYFEHDAGHDVMVFTDSNTDFRPVEGHENVTFRPRGEESSIFQLTERARMIPTTYIVQDYNYLIPQVDLTGEHELTEGYAGGVFEYGAHYFSPEEGAALARIRAEERAATRRVILGRSDLFALRAGARLTVEEHPRFDSAELLLVEVEHEARQVTQMHGDHGDGKPAYRNTFRAIRASVPYHPPRVTPKPVIAGVISAQVEPGPGDEIGQYADIDPQGRYTVRFFFDPAPLGARPKSSLPVRMAQPHAGPNYGLHFPLKPGVEVLVAFTEGDPDRPFIVGAVPNPVTPTPVDRHNLLFNKFQSASGVYFEIKDV